VTPSTTSLRFTLCAAALTAVLAAGCGSSSTPASGSDATTSAPAPATGSTITIKNFKFGDPITVAAGATVTVKNADSSAHTVSSDADKGFDTGDIAGGASATFTAPMAAGKYAFHCNIHNYMQGSLTVSG
jgi:plastocyanin